MQSFSASRRTRRTPLSSRVEAAGARAYTVYNHMLLATAFGALEEDYRHLRSHAQVWDVSCQRIIELKGRDAARLAQLITPRDLSRMTPGRMAYAPLTDETGAILNDPVILQLAEDHFWVSIADSDVQLWAKGLALGLRLFVEVREIDVTTIAVQGPKAETLIARLFGEGARAVGMFRFAEMELGAAAGAAAGATVRIGRAGYSKQGGFEIYVERPELAGAIWDALMAAGEDLSVRAGCPNLIERIEGGLLSYGADMTPDDTPLETGLERFCALDKPVDFLGRDALRRRRDAGISRQLRGLVLDGGPLCPVLTNPELSVAGADGRRRAGVITSHAHSPTLGRPIAVAMIDRPFWEHGETLTLDTSDGPRTATVGPLPFDLSTAPAVAAAA